MALDLSDLDTFDFNDRPQAAKNKPKTGLDLFDDLDEFEPRKHYSRRGSVEARNKQAEPDILSKRAQRFQLGAQLDAELSPVMGRGEDLIAHQQRVEEAAATVRPDLPAGWNRQEFESFMDAESGGMGVTPGTGRTAEDAAVVGQNPGVVGAKFREGWRTTKAGMAADEYLRTGKVTVGFTPFKGAEYLEGPAAEKYVRELASVTEDTALAEAFDKQVGAGARALTSTLSQPEQLLSIPGGIVGAMVGQPTLGAALGAAPSTVKGYYSDLLANLQAGASHDIASANALAGAGIDFATETLGGRFGASGGVLGAGARSAAEEASAELGRMGSDYAFSLADESFASKLPKTFGEGAERVGEAGIAGGLGAAIMVGAPRLPGKLGEGLAAAREMLARAGGVSDGRPDVVQPKANTAPSIDAPISIAPTSIDTVDTQITTGINTEEAKREGVNPAGVSKEREIPAKEDTLSAAPLSPVQETAPTPKMGAKEAVAVAMAESQDKATKDPVYAEWANANRKERSEQIQARARELMEPVIGTGPVVSQNQSQTLPATPVAPPVSEAPVASQEAATSVPASAPVVASAPAGQAARDVQTPVTSTQVPQVSNTKPKRTKTSTPKPISDKDALAQAFTELQTRSLNDPEFQKQVTANPSLMRQMATQRASEIVAQSSAPKAPEAPVTAAPTQAETPALDVAAGGPTTDKPKFASKDDFYTELYSGVGDKEAAEARKIPDKIVVYDGDTDLASIDPDVAAKVQEATQKQGATGARPRAFQYNGKVYFNLEGVRPGQAKSTFLHEARVHLAAKAEPARVSALAGRVVALAKAGDATAKAAADTVSKEYPGLAKAARDGSGSAKDLSREELLADFAQRVYDRVKSGQGVSGTIKRLYSDVMSYLRDLYTTVAKKYLGEKFALSITDVDILDAVRYGRTAAGFKGEAAPTRLAEAAQRVKDATPAMMFVGEQASGDNIGLDEAKRLADDGVDQQTIRMRTGWFQSPWDNKWRREVDDSGAGFKQDFASLEESKVFGTPKTYRLADVLNHPSLFAEYPELADVKFTKRAGFMDIFKTLQGSYDADSNEISLTPYVQDPISTLLHEIQHWIQNKETFATGGNQNSAVAALPQAQKELLAKELIADLEKQYSDTLDTYDSLTKLRDSEEVLQKLAAYADAADVADTKAREAGRGWFDDNDENRLRRDARKSLEAALTRAGITADISALYSNISRKVEKGMGRYSATFAAVNESISDTEKKAAELTTRLGGLTSGNPEVLNNELKKHSRAYEFYQSLAGEIEARAVQERMRYPMEERVSKDPYEATLVRDRIRKEDAIVTYDGGRAGQESRTNTQPGTEVPKKAPLQATEERIAKTVATLFTPKGAASTDAQLMGERAIGTSNELRIAGEVLVRDLMSSLSGQIGSLPKRTQMLYRYNIGQYLAGDPTAAPNIPKDVRTTLDAMREMLDNNTMRLIALGAVESKDIPKMLNNLGRWIHRDFDVFHHEPGDIVSPGGYQQMVQEMAKRGNDLVAKVLPEAMDEMRLPAADVITKIGAITQNKGGKDAWRQESSKMLREVQGKKPLKKGTKKTNAAIRKQAENYLRAMAGKWGIGKNTPLDGPDGIIERLAALSTKGEDVLKEAAARYANSLLDPNASPYNEVFQRPTTSPMGIDDSALDKARTRVPEWVRVLWGEFKDPVPRFLVSLDNQADIIAKFTALAEYKQKGLASGRVVPNTKDTIDYEMRRKGYHLLQKPNDKLYYGPLENTWVKMEDLPMLEVGALKDFVGRQIRHSMGAGLLKILSVPGQVAKMMLVAGDMSSQMVQAASAVVFYSRLKLAALPKAIKGARYTSLGGTFLGKAIDDKQLDSDVKALIQQGVLVNNALAGDARRKLIELVKKPGEEFLSVPVSVGKTVGRGFSAFQDGLSRMMALPDEVSKIMMVYGRMEDLADIYPNKSRDELLALAGEETMQTTPTLNREAPLARFLANSGVINPFATFLASNFRNFYNHFSLAKKYGSMPGKEAKMYAVKELSVASLKAAGIFAITKGLVAAGYATGAGAQVMFASLMQALGADDEEQEEIKKQAEAAAKMQREHYPAMRVLVPEWQLGEVQMLREIAPDIYTYGALQRFDPSPMGAIMSAVSRDDPEELAAILSDNLFSEAPLIKGFAAVLGTIDDALADSASRALPDYQADARRAAEVKKFWDGAGEIALNFTPGTIKRVYKQLTDDVDYTALETFITNTGGTVGVLDVRKRTGEIAGDYKAFVDGRKKSIGKIVSTKDGLAFDSEIDLVDDLTERAVAWRKARSKIAAVQSLGKSDLWIKDAIKSNPYASSLSKEEINSLLTGRFVVPNYNKWLKEQRETDLKDPKNSMRKEEVRAQYARYEQDLSKFYEGLQELLQKEGITKR